MRLGWQEIRRRAKAFSLEWKLASYEKGECQTFYNEFFEIFGIHRKRVAIFEKKIELVDANRRGFIDLFWPSVLLVEQKSAGKDLLKAEGQAYDYVLGLRDRDVPRFVLVCDFQRFRLIELATRKETRFTLPELHEHVEEFGFMLGVERRHYGRQAAVNIKAAELLGTVRDALESRDYKGVPLERIMVRLLFCLFADDTAIFETKDDFLYLIEERTDPDGGNVGVVLNQLFEILDTPSDQRLAGADPEFAKFPYVNGALFTGHLRTAAFDAKMRDDLIAACKFDWGAVSPAIFGSLFQSVMDSAERRAKGAHYTTEPNIMKLICPLFLDDLHAEYDRLAARHDGGKRKALLDFQEKLGRLEFFDPACGCGNFLVVTYRELRRLEQRVLELLFDPSSPMLYEVEALSVIRLDHFHGIELEEFPAHIAEVAMWMTEHLANIELGRVFGKVFADIPLTDSAKIVHGDALDIDWEDVLPHVRCFIVMGNPPFIGAKFQSTDQRQQVRDFARLGKSGGTLDYVAAWFLKAGAYIAKGPTRIAFVATNSITQGKQVAQLWPILFDRYGLEIAFAHRTFAWGSDARGKAHVHVVIIGLTHRDFEPKEKKLFSYETVNGEPSETQHRKLSAYLFAADSAANPHLVVEGSSQPICSVKGIRYGSQPIDGGHLILDADQRQQFSQRNPDLSEFVRPFIGAVEYINGGNRWILALQDATPSDLRTPDVKERLNRVKEFRLASNRAVTRELAKTPSAFAFTTIPKASFLVVPEVSSERREYVPIGWLQSPTIPSNLVRAVEDADLFDFGMLTSKMHMAWLGHIGGRLKSDYRYSIGLVYNTFPWPEASPSQKSTAKTLAQAVLDARRAWPTSSLADLYDRDTMPANLRKAHTALDSAIDGLYRKKPFNSDRDRVEHLFGLYEKLVNPLEAAAEKQNKRYARRLKRGGND